MPLFSHSGCLMALFQGDEPEIEHQVGVSGYADSFFQQPSLAMSSGSPPEERLSRKSKSENRVCCCSGLALFTHVHTSSSVLQFPH